MPDQPRPSDSFARPAAHPAEPSGDAGAPPPNRVFKNQRPVRIQPSGTETRASAQLCGICRRRPADELIQGPGGARLCTPCFHELSRAEVVASDQNATLPRPTGRLLSESRAVWEAERASSARFAAHVASGILAGGLLIIVVSKLVTEPPAESLEYLVRFGVTWLASVVLYAAASTFLLELERPLWLTLLRLAAALAAADAVQHILNTIAPLLPSVAIAAAVLVYVGFLAQLFDMDLTDAIFLGVVVYVTKFTMRHTLFAGMFG